MGVSVCVCVFVCVCVCLVSERDLCLCFVSERYVYIVVSVRDVGLCCVCCH